LSYRSRRSTASRPSAYALGTAVRTGRDSRTRTAEKPFVDASHWRLCKRQFFADLRARHASRIRQSVFRLCERQKQNAPGAESEGVRVPRKIGVTDLPDEKISRWSYRIPGGSTACTSRHCR